MMLLYYWKQSLIGPSLIKRNLKEKRFLKVSFSCTFSFFLIMVHSWSEPYNQGESRTPSNSRGVSSLASPLTSELCSGVILSLPFPIKTYISGYLMLKNYQYKNRSGDQRRYSITRGSICMAHSVSSVWKTGTIEQITIINRKIIKHYWFIKRPRVFSS